MLVRIDATTEVNANQIVIITQPNTNEPDQFMIQLSNARQIGANADAVDRCRAAMHNWDHVREIGGPTRFGASEPQNVSLGERQRERMDIKASDVGSLDPVMSPDASPTIDDD